VKEAKEVKEAWAAGLYEGEGYATVLRGKNKDGTIRRRVRLQFGISISDPDVLEKFAKIVGVGNLSGPRIKPNRKPIWTWRAHGWEAAKRLFQMFAPHLGKRRMGRFKEVLSLESINPPKIKGLGRPKGFAAHNRKASPEQVRDARKRLAEGESQSALGREMGITQAQVWKMKEGVTYRDVT
jgi:hypothetical protein